MSQSAIKSEGLNQKSNWQITLKLIRVTIYYCFFNARRFNSPIARDTCKMSDSRWARISLKARTAPQPFKRKRFNTLMTFSYSLSAAMFKCHLYAFVSSKLPFKAIGDLHYPACPRELSAA